MKRRIILLLILAFAISTEAVNTSPLERAGEVLPSEGSGEVPQEKFFSLNGQWDFALARTAEQADSIEATGFYSPDYNSASFVRTPVPSNWAVLGFEEPVYRGFKDDKASEGFYRRAFRVPSSFAGKRVLLHFGGVWESAEVWLNGIRLGRHDSGYTSFAFDVSKFLKVGADNVLAVRVRQVCPGYKTDVYDDWTLGGIYRDVTLESMPRKRWIDKVTVTTDFDGNYRDADLIVRTMVGDTHKETRPGNYNTPGTPYQLRFTLTDDEGKAVARKTETIESHYSSYNEQRTVFHVLSPRQWNAEHPNLYHLSVELLEDGKPSHERTVNVGFREIEIKGNTLCVNGQPVKLRGVNRHDEWPDVGRATRREHWLKDLTLMKQANINYIRACHYAHNKGFIDLCDSIGMYVGEEISLGGAGELMYQSSFVQPVMLRTVETVERDLNNPSIIYWSVGNEDPFTELHLEAVKTVKALDGMRPCLLPWSADERLPKDIDILAPHYWTAHEYDSLASQSSRPVISTEWVHAYGTQRMGGLDDCWRALTKHPAGAGGAVWMWADQGIRTPVKKDKKVYSSKTIAADDYLRINSQGWDGITDSYRRPTRDFYEVKAVYAPVYVPVKKVEVRRGAGKVSLPLNNDYDFTDLSETNIKYQLFVDGRQVSEGALRSALAPHAHGTLDIPTSKAGSKGTTAYVWITFSDKNGNEITRNGIELAGLVSSTEKAKAPAMTLDESTGLPRGFRPVVWHKLNEGDQTIKNRNFASGTSPDSYKIKVEKLERNGNGWHSEVLYTINDSNHIKAVYDVVVPSGGHGSIAYSITPQLQTSYVPVVGLAWKMPAGANVKSWTGLGPDETFPNKKAAGVFGVWNADKLTGLRQAESVDISDGTRFVVNGYIEPQGTGELLLLSHVLGRPEKGRLNYPEYQLRNGDTFIGKVDL